MQSAERIPGVILLDTMGELSRMFSGAAVAFIGGSLVPCGGHNMLEPAYYSKPVIFGPHMDNFPMAGDFLENSAALEVKDADDIADAVIELLNDSDKAVSMGRNAKLIVEKNAGAVKKAVELVRRYIGSS
jgi:3-deoxy-D-manno-octulosonic-acid transferase